MEPDIIVHKGRAKVLSFECMEDLSNDTFVSEIRLGKNQSTPLIATWHVEFQTDGKDGKLLLWLSDDETAAIEARTGYTDIKRIQGGDGGEAVHMFDPLFVVFKRVVTA